MLPIGWQDRETHKQGLSKWLDTGTSVFAISVKDSQELDDIDEWLREKFDDGLVANSTFKSDAEILKYTLLEDLVYGLDEKNFNEFMKEIQNTPTLSPVSISQSVGNGARAKNEIEYEKIDQKADVHIDGILLQKHTYFEKNIHPPLNAFVKDIQKLAKKSKILLVIKFKKFESEDAGSDFLVWFQEFFLTRISQIQNLTVCVIFQGNIDRLTKINDGQKIHLKTLNLQDILDVTKGHLNHHEAFCKGVVDADDKTVEYKVFKRKFHVQMHELIQAQQNG